MAPARYLATVFLVIAVSFAIWTAYAATEFGRMTRTGYASCTYVEKKIALGAAVPSPKLVIVAGSNAAAGIDAAALAKSLSIHAFNFALVATFSPGFQLFEARKVLKPGDAVLLASEYLAYEYGSPTNALVDTVYSCGLGYWRSLDWPERLFFVFALRPQRYFSTRTVDAAMKASVGAVLEKTVAANGDLGNPIDTSPPDANTHQPLVIRFLRQSNGTREIAEFVAWAKTNNVAVFATWPNTLDFPQYESNPAFAQIEDFYRGLGVAMIGKPKDAMVPPELLADTIYHLTRPGIAMRTEMLTTNLKADPAFAAWQEKSRVSE